MTQENKMLLNGKWVDAIPEPYYKFAWLPKIVRTWRPQGTKAIIWMQRYFKNERGAYVTRLGFFSYEFYHQ